MPEIPRYERQRTIPGTSGNVQMGFGSAGAAGEGLSKVANTLTGIISEHADRIKKQDEINQELLLRSQYDEEHRAFKDMETQKNGSDSYGSLDRGKEFKTSMLKKYTTDLKSENVKNSISQYIGSRTESMLDNFSVHESAQRGVVTKQARDSVIYGLLKDAYSGESMDTTSKQWVETIAKQNEAGLLSDEEAVEHIRAGESQLAGAHIEGLFNRKPSQAIAALKTPEIRGVLKEEQLSKYDKIAKEKGSLEVAYETATKAEQKFGVSEKDDNYHLQEKYDEINKQNISPEEKEKAYNILERNYRVYNQALQDKFNSSAGKMLNTFNSRPDMILSDFQNTPEFSSLTESQQVQFSGKLNYEIHKRKQEERSIVASERADKNYRDSEIAKKEKEQADQFKENSRSQYNKLISDPTALATLPQSEIDSYATKMTGTDHTAFIKEWQRSKKDLTGSMFIRNQIKDIFKNLPYDDDTKFLLDRGIRKYVGDEKDLSKIKVKIAEATQLILSGKTTKEKNLFGTDKKITIKKGDKKLVGTKHGKPVYELPDGNWQVGD